MSPCFVITGTDTDVGKTVFAAALVGALDGCYWKPVQCGLEPETDSAVVRRLSGLPADRVLPEAYRLALPASPHLAAERESIVIDPDRLVLPQTGRPLIVEGAGGLMVPLTRNMLMIDLFARWRVPIILCARTKLGTINHSLLSIEALRRRDIPLHGIAFIGDEATGPEETIATIGAVRRLGRLPFLAPLDPARLAATFGEHFRALDFLGEAT
ncbi:MAG TPA: dethiobiotin synthase [Hyphomicrobiaceae bacterium]|nr:dethiobiotin synthase [Hyphomicrobiaceae bacterium]